MCTTLYNGSQTTQFFSDALLPAVLAANRFTVSVYTCNKKIMELTSAHVISSEWLAFCKGSTALLDFQPLIFAPRKVKFGA